MAHTGRHNVCIKQSCSFKSSRGMGMLRRRCRTRFSKRHSKTHGIGCDQFEPPSLAVRWPSVLRLP